MECISLRRPEQQKQKETEKKTGRRWKVGMPVKVDQLEEKVRNAMESFLSFCFARTGNALFPAASLNSSFQTAGAAVCHVLRSCLLSSLKEG